MTTTQADELAPSLPRSERRRQRRQRRRRRWLKRLLIGLAVILVLAGAGAFGVWHQVTTERIPPLSVSTHLAASVRFPGPPPALKWPARGQAAIEVEGLGPLGHSGPTTAQPIASVAKIMTAYVILSDHPLAVGSTGFQLTVTQDDYADWKARKALAQSVVAVDVGESLDEYQLLQGLMIPSANNFAVMLADYDGGVAPFLAKMNATARSLGLTSTTYTDPSGLDPRTVSTVADQIRLVKAAMALPMFAGIVAEQSVTLPVAGVVNNFASLVGHDGFRGVKTGSDSRSGGTFVFVVTRLVDGQSVTMYGAVFGIDIGQQLTPPILAATQSAAQHLVDSAFASISVKTLLAAHTPVVTVTNAQNDRVVAVTDGPLNRLGWGGMVFHLRLTTQPVGPTVTDGQVEGSVEFTTPGYGTVGPTHTTLVATAAMPLITLKWKLHHMF